MSIVLSVHQYHCFLIFLQIPSKSIKHQRREAIYEAFMEVYKPVGNVCWDHKAVEKSIRLIQHTGDLLCFCSFRCLAIFLHRSCRGKKAQTCRGELTVASEELQCRDCILSQPRPDNADVTMKALQATDRLCGYHLAHVASIWPPQDLQDCILHSDPSANFQASYWPWACACSWEHGGNVVDTSTSCVSACKSILSVYIWF